VVEARTSGQGQVVDAAIVDGTAHLQTMLYGQLAAGTHHADRRVSGLLDGGVPFYDVYGTSDGRHVAVGPLESKFYADFCERLAPYLGERAMPEQYDLARFAEMRETLAATFAARTMADWARIFEGTDACVAPVLTPTEAAGHPHLAARGTLVERDGMLQPAPAPRFSRTAPSLTTPPPATAGSDTREALAAWGIDDVDELIAEGIAAQA
jgi:alpha-methylacyl-CoA racemase